MTLTILSVAYTLAPVHPATAGGSEQILGQIDSALVEAGHRSIVVACKGSSVSGILVESARLPDRLDDGFRRKAQEQHRLAIARALNEWPIDLIHMHGLDFAAYLPPAGPPALITLHLPPEWYPPGIFNLSRPDTFLHCVSGSQENSCPAGTRLLPPVPNGIPIRDFPFRAEKQNYSLCLGRVCPEKGFHLAIEAAEPTGSPLYIAGEVFGYEAHEQYFREQIQPKLNGISPVFLGPIGLKEKALLLGHARALLLPSLVPETSSLAAMEALACGTPVIAFPSGAIPEIVDHGKTGFLVTNAREMAEAIRNSDRIEPWNCRRAAEERYSSERMIEDYLRLYRLAKDGMLHSLLRGRPDARP